MRKIWRVGLALLPMAASAASWRGDFETGDLSQWSGAQRASEERLQVVESPVRQGRHALRASGRLSALVHPGGEQEGSESVYRWSTLFPSDFPRTRRRQTFAWWYPVGRPGAPPLEFLVVRDELRLRVGGPRGPVLWRAPLRRERWNDFALRVRWSADPRQGLVELYHGGRQVLPPTAVATLLAPGQGVCFKLGLSRNRHLTRPAALFHDGVVQAERLEDVLPPRRVPPPPALAETMQPPSPALAHATPGAHRAQAPRRRAPLPRAVRDSRRQARELLEKVLAREREKAARGEP